MTDAGELRFDPLTHEWVNIVGHRQDRPNLPDDACPFCVGGLEAPDPYVVRWFENRWPALATGAEVILFSPQH
ncbi:MAG TPA: galactose-1-phosphate uridylyltransferase, partial [Acidimicrobiia bacterium]|nr:galactose-1-phosphate uridylyltransferase [Acidimicrobiia bacterium]